MISRISPRKLKKRRGIKSFGAGRVCKKHGCKQRLSIYNSELYCHVHRREAAE